MRPVCFFLLIIIHFHHYSQTSQRQIDSLRQVLPSLHGIERIDAQYSLATLLTRVDEKESDSLSLEALKDATSLGYQRGIVMSSLVRATLANLKSRFSESRFILKGAIELAIELDDHDALAKAYTILAGHYLRKSEYELATENHLLALKAAENLGQIDLQVTNLMNLGLIHQRLNALDEADNFFSIALELCIQGDLRYRAGQLYVNLGVLEFRRQNIGLSIDYNERALNIFKEFGEKSQEALSLQNLGFAQAFLGNYDKAESYYNQVVEIREKIDDKRGMAAVFLNKARLAYELKDLAQSKELAERALAYARSIQNSLLIKEISMFLSLIYEEIGNSRRALQYFKIYSITKDSIEKASNKARITELTSDYEYESQQQELALSKEKLDLAENRQQLLESQKWILALATSILLVLVAFIIFFYRMRLSRLKTEKMLYLQKQENSLLEREKLEKDVELKSIELKTMAAQIVQKNELINQFKSDLNQLRDKDSLQAHSDELQRLATKVDGRSGASISLEDFRLKFNLVHPNFVTGIIDRYNSLTKNEIDLCIFMKTNLTHKDIAQLQNISYEGVKKAIQRLYKKMGLKTVEELRLFLYKI